VVAVSYNISGGGRNRPEQVAGFLRNGWPESIGIGGRNRAEYASLIVSSDSVATLMMKT
jgi:hypothetical protein